MDYLSGFGNHFSTEALPNTLPKKQNSPQQVNHGLYAEQLTGSAFTAPRTHNLKTWLYRTLPSVMQHDFEPVRPLTTEIVSPTPPNQFRWSPEEIPSNPTHLIDSLKLQALNSGGEIYNYACNKSMTSEFFYSADGDWLFVPESGELKFRTEMGILEVSPCEICVIPRGIKWQVELLESTARGYIIENKGAPFQLPDLGPIGANGLAYPRHFQYPTAAFEDSSQPAELLCKYEGHLFRGGLDYNPLNVVAWHGNYAPYKYNLKLFNTINTVSFDHPDPSIFTVLTSQTDTPGVANIDFVIFPARWMVAENTFRPPYFHRNIMSEYMGLIEGAYDAKQSGFVPGGSSLHNCMTPHGPDSNTFEKASSQSLAPERYENTLAFMFESSLIWQVSQQAYDSDTRQKDYTQCWQNMNKHFKQGKN